LAEDNGIVGINLQIMILSVSRRTDIPAFYSDWFFNRIREGFVYARNPMNKNSVSKISLNPQVIDCIVFWTKNPSLKFIENLPLISAYNYYFQFTITPYDAAIELNVPAKQLIIESFKKISQKIGKDKIIWRYDPVLLNNENTIAGHIKQFEQLAKQISSYSEKCILSFIDFYKKCERNLKESSIRTPNESEIFNLAKEMQQIAQNYELKLETCAEEYNLESYGIKHGKCIDNDLIERITKKKIKAKKDKNQREACGCIESIDIGEYNTCIHNCLYCYANSDSETVIRNTKNHDPNSPLLVGNIKETDIIAEKKMASLLENTLFD
jgi:DNA repair photolyase